MSEELKQLFNQHIRDTKENEIPVENLALLLIQEHVKEFQNVEEMEKYEKVIKGVIKRMAKNNEGLQLIRNEKGEELVRFHIGAINN